MTQSPRYDLNKLGHLDEECARMSMCKNDSADVFICSECILDEKHKVQVRKAIQDFIRYEAGSEEC